MNTSLIKFLAGALLFVLWAALDILKIQDPVLITAIVGTLSGLGIHGATSANRVDAADVPDEAAK